MVCDSCKERDAVVHLTQIVENAVTQLHLCEKCAAEKGVETTVAMPKHPLAGLLQAAQQAPLSHGDAVRCTFCSATLRDFKASGRLGCAHCYGAFESSLRELLRRVHGTPGMPAGVTTRPAPTSWNGRRRSASCGTGSAARSRASSSSWPPTCGTASG